MIDGSHELIALSLGHVKEALALWNPALPPACDEACTLLREAGEELEIVRSAMENDRQLTSVDVRELTLLRLYAARLTRLVDASEAFLRGRRSFPTVDAAAESPVAPVRA